MDLRFIVDGMLGSLARKLRIYGFDTSYDAYSEDLELLEKAGGDHRILLTSDQELFRTALKRNLKAILINEDSDEDRMVSILKELGLKDVHPTPTRCPVCNGLLEPISEGEVVGKLPQNISNRYKEFYRCQSCGKLYWRGSHWRRIEAFSKYVEEKVKLG